MDKGSPYTIPVRLAILLTFFDSITNICKKFLNISLGPFVRPLIIRYGQIVFIK